MASWEQKAGEEKAKDGKKENERVEPVVVVLLTLLHRDYLRWEKERKEEGSRLRDEEQDENQAW
jgi:hypothetical protein